MAMSGGAFIDEPSPQVIALTVPSSGRDLAVWVETITRR